MSGVVQLWVLRSISISRCPVILLLAGMLLALVAKKPAYPKNYGYTKGISIAAAGGYLKPTD